MFKTLAPFDVIPVSCNGEKVFLVFPHRRRRRVTQVP